ncbi:hypothetical protein GCM10023339_41240 [Alloalcanivorax gelatiniphagus]
MAYDFDGVECTGWFPSDWVYRPRLPVDPHGGGLDNVVPFRRRDI